MNKDLFLKNLNDDMVIGKICLLYKNLHKEAYDNEYTGKNYKIFLFADGTVDYAYCKDDYSIDGAICVSVVDGFVDISSECLIDIRIMLDVDETNKFEDYLIEHYIDDYMKNYYAKDKTAEIFLKKYFNWEEYSLFNKDKYNEYLKKSWYELVEEYDELEALDDIQTTVKNLNDNIL